MAEKNDAKKRDQEIERKIMEDCRKINKQYDVLVIGAESSGKTAIINQMLHGDVFEEEMARRRSVAYGNVVTAMLSYCDAVENLGVWYSEPTSLKHVAHLRRLHEDTDGISQISSTTLTAIKSLYEDEAIKAVRKNNKHMLSNSAEYFMSYLDRITSDYFIPTAQDIAVAQNSATGIMEVKFTRGEAERELPFRIFEIRTLRSQMKKWTKCFDVVNLINYVVDVSEYDQKLKEDNSKNRIHESLQLFDQMCNNNYFLFTDVIVFLNKKDLFQLKFPYASIREAFPDYSGGEDTVESSIAYISGEFMKLNKNPKRFMYTHACCATHPQITSSDKTEVVEAMINAILQRSLEKMGLID